MANKPYIVVSYYTDEYKEYADKLIESCNEFGIPSDIWNVPSRGDWYDNVTRKPEFILHMMRRHRDKNIVWVDADGWFMEYPELFDSLHCDLAVYRYKGISPLTATLFVGNNSLMRAFIRTWDLFKPARNSFTGDQSAFQTVLGRGWASNIDIRDLPESYCRVPHYCVCEEPVITQKVASKRFRDCPDRVMREQYGYREFVVVNCHTYDYKDMAGKLLSQIPRFVHTHFQLIEDKGKGTPEEVWGANIRYKPKFMRQMMLMYPDYNILWIDADAQVKGPLDYFYDLGDKCDFSLGYTDRAGRDANNKVYAGVMTGTVFINNSPDALDFMDEWIEFTDSEKGRNAEQIAFDKALKCTEIDIKYQELPKSYIYVTKYKDRDDHQGVVPIITHDVACHDRIRKRQHMEANNPRRWSKALRRKYAE